MEIESYLSDAILANIFEELDLHVFYDMVKENSLLERFWNVESIWKKHCEKSKFCPNVIPTSYKNYFGILKKEEFAYIVGFQHRRNENLKELPNYCIVSFMETKQDEKIIGSILRDDGNVNVLIEKNPNIVSSNRNRQVLYCTFSPSTMMDNYIYEGVCPHSNYSSAFTNNNQFLGDRHKKRLLQTFKRVLVDDLKDNYPIIFNEFIMISNSSIM
jgi:hypothetical protein